MQWTTTGDRITLPYVAPEDDLQSTPATIKALAEAVVAELELATPVGAISPYMGDVAPDGWLICDGSEYDPADLPELYAVNSAFHAADAPGEFRVPDLRGRSPIGTATITTGPVAPIDLGARRGDWKTGRHGHEITKYKYDDTRVGGSGGTGAFGVTLNVNGGAPDTPLFASSYAPADCGADGLDHNFHPVTGVNFIVYAGRSTAGISPLSELAPVTTRMMIESRLAKAGIGEEEVNALREQLAAYDREQKEVAANQGDAA